MPVRAARPPHHRLSLEALEPRLLLDASPADLLREGFHGDWAGAQGGGASDHFIERLVTDADGSVYGVGWFDNTADFDPGPGIHKLTADEYGDGFVFKLDPSGSLAWAHAIGADSFDLANGIALDPAGNVLVTGSFQETVDFDPGDAVFELTASDSAKGHAFVLKLDPSGNFVWARGMGSSGLLELTSGNAVACDSSGSVYVGGKFAGMVDFDPGPGSSHRTAVGGRDGYVLKLDSNGSFQWVRPFGSTEWDDVRDLAVDPSGSIAIIGSINGTTVFGPGVVLTPSRTHTMYTARLNPAGTLLWAQELGGSERALANGVAVDAGGNVHVAGWFIETLDFDAGPGTHELTAGDTVDGFVQKLDAGGDFVWARQFGGTESTTAADVVVDPAGQVHVVGEFRGAVDFDPGSGTLTLNGGSEGDVFLSKLTASGDLLWAGSAGGAGWDQGEAVTLDSGGAALLAGRFTKPVDLDPSDGVLALSAKTWRSFVVRWERNAGSTSIAGTVWDDLDEDGRRDAGEPGIDGVDVQAFRDDGDAVFEPGADDVLVASAPTDAAGQYLLDGLDPSAVWVNVDGSQPAMAGIVRSGAVPLVPLAPAQDRAGVDIGLVQSVFSVADVAVDEGDGGSQDALFTVSLSHDPLVPVSVDYATADRTATAGIDYSARTGTLTFNPGGPLEQTVAVPVHGDTDIEGVESFFLQLSGSTGPDLRDARGMGVLVDDDGTVLPLAAGAPAQFTDGSGNLVTVSLRGPGDGFVQLPAPDNADALAVVVRNTSRKSSLTITTPRGTETTLRDGVVDGILGTFTAGATDLLGDFVATRAPRKITFDDVADAHIISIGPPPLPTAAVSMAFDHVSNLTIESATQIGSLTFTDWLDDGPPDSVNAPRIASLRAKGKPGNLKLGIDPIPGHFQADLHLHGIPGVATTLGSAIIDGAVTDSAWRIRGNAKAVNVSGDVADFALDVHSKLVSLRMGDTSNTTVNVAGHVGALSARRWIGGAVDAESIGTFLATGLPGDTGCRGDVDIDVTLTGHANPKAKTLVRAKVDGDLTDAAWDFSGNIGSLTVLGAVNNWTLDVHSSVGSLKLGDVGTATVVVDGPVRYGSALRWLTGSLTAASVGTFKVPGKPLDGIPGDVGIDLTLTNAGLKRPLRHATVLGHVLGGTWRVPGGAAKVVAGSTDASWRANFAGVLSTLIIKGSASGVLAAASVGAGVFGGDLVDARFLAGTNLGDDCEIGGEDGDADTYGPGYFRELRVAGDMQRSVVTAGLHPTDDHLDDLNDAHLGGNASYMRVVRVGGAIDADSRVDAARLPGRAIVGGVRVTPRADDRFGLRPYAVISSGVTDALGEVTLDFAGSPVILELHDENTLAPLVGYAVAAAIDRATGSFGGITIVPPTGGMEPQFVVVEGDGPPAAAAVEGLTPVSGGIEKLPVYLNNIGNKKLQDVASNTLAKAVYSDATDATLSVLSTAASSVVSLIGMGLQTADTMVDGKFSKWIAGSPYAKTEYMTYEQAAEGIRQGRKDETVSSAIQMTLEKSLDAGAVVGMVMDLGSDTVSQLAIHPAAVVPSLAVRKTTIFGFDFYACAPMPLSQQLRQYGLVSVHVPTRAEVEPQQRSLELIKKDEFLRGFSVPIDDAGNASVSVPIGDYQMLVRSPGYRAERHEVNVDTGGVNMTLDLADGSAPRDPGIIVTPTSGLTTTEEGDVAAFAVSLRDRPTAAVTFGLYSTDTTEGTIGISQITFTPQDWNVAQTVWVWGEDDFVEDGNKSYRIVLQPATSDDPLYDGINPADVSLTNTDDDRIYRAGKWQVAVNIVGSGYVYDDTYGRIDTSIGDHVGKYSGTEVFNLVASSRDATWYVNGVLFSPFRGLSESWWTVFPSANGKTYTVVFT